MSTEKDSKSLFLTYDPLAKPSEGSKETMKARYSGAE
jgi:hypothetical protein